jgi:transposase-like protein
MCCGCGKTSTPEPKKRGYSEEVREKAVRMYVEGNNFRRIGRPLNVNHQSVVNWVNAYHEKAKDVPLVRFGRRLLKSMSCGVLSGIKKQSVYRNCC